MRQEKSFSLPFDIALDMVDGVVNIESELGRALPSYEDDLETARKVGVIEGIEHLLVSLARADVDLSRPEFAVAIRDCVAKLQQ
ncbi:hypothetical protein [Paraburkholderia graminis]|uniref:hypothetical protein n=1 Tax=Paraburkholderia graminis TaxID=60548 RepID=UPI0038BD40D6